LARWIQWWWTDLILAAALMIILRESAHPATGSDVLGQLQLADRRSVYNDALQITTLFAGFNAVGFTIYLGFSSRNVNRIKEAVGTALLRVWIAALVTPWVCAVVMVCCYVTDRGGKASGNATRWVALGSLIVVILQMVRIVWVFYQLAITDLQVDRPPPAVSKDEIRVVSPR
jgi:hypothetical protein